MVLKSRGNGWASRRWHPIMRRRVGLRKGQILHPQLLEYVLASPRSHSKKTKTSRQSENRPKQKEKTSRAERARKQAEKIAARVLKKAFSLQPKKIMLLPFEFYNEEAIPDTVKRFATVASTPKVRRYTYGELRVIERQITKAMNNIGIPDSVFGTLENLRLAVIKQRKRLEKPKDTIN